MNELHVFVSVGTPATSQQEAFLKKVEERLQAEGLIPHTVGRNTFSADAPLKTVTELLNKCCGTIVIALERSHFGSGTENRGGPRQKNLADIRLPTPWNQIEAAMSYARGLPLMIIIEHGIKSEGLLERGHEWYVQWVTPTDVALNSAEFNGVLADWKKKLVDASSKATSVRSASDLTIKELVGTMKPAQLWGVLGALAALVVGAFVLGSTLFAARDAVH